MDGGMQCGEAGEEADYPEVPMKVSVQEIGEGRRDEVEYCEEYDSARCAYSWGY
jgi:hypothetical protein